MTKLFAKNKYKSWFRLKRLHSTESASEREIYQRQINATDRQIENLVYELYGLTDEEIKIVEENSQKHLPHYL